MHWILQNNLFNEAAYQTLLDTLERFNLPYSIHKVIPFIGELVPAPELPHKNVICMGSYSLRHSAKKFGWDPGVFDLEPFDFTKQLEKWGDLMLNADSVVVPFKDAIVERDTFIRPIHDSKVFAGNVFEAKAFYDWQRKVCVLEEDYGNSLTKDTLIQLSNPKVIYAEYRFWIVNGKIVTYSLYKRGDRVFYSSEVDQHVIDFAAGVARCGDITLSVQPHRAWVLDVCETPDGMRIVETGTLNSCGFYAADLTKLVLALEDAFNQV
jgi:hypothetical protein